MTALLIALLVVGLPAAAIAAAHRLLDHDGGPRHEPLPTRDKGWHPSLPTHPYARTS